MHFPVVRTCRNPFALVVESLKKEFEGADPLRTFVWIGARRQSLETTGSSYKPVAAAAGACVLVASFGDTVHCVSASCLSQIYSPSTSTIRLGASQPTRRVYCILCQ